MPAPQVDTRKAARRPLKFTTTAELRAELDRLERAHRAGTLRKTGNWTPGEIFDHLGKVIEFAFDGFPPGHNPPIFVRLMGRALKGYMSSGRTLPPGFVLSPDAAYMMPTPGASFDVGLARLRRTLDRLDSGERLEQLSPAFGVMGHDRWLRLHFGHAQHHLGYLWPDSAK